MKPTRHRLAERIAGLLCSALIFSGSQPVDVAAARLPPAAHAATAHSAQWKRFVTGLKDKYKGRTLRLIMINDPFVPAFNTMAAAFSQLTGAHVAVDTFGYDAAYQKEVLACNQHDPGYDLLVFDIPWTERFAKCTTPLARYINGPAHEIVDYDDVFPVMRAASTWNNAIVGFPFAPYFVLQTYNARYYTALKLRPATTLDEMIRNANAANTTAEFPHVYGTSMNNQAGSAVGQAFFEYIYSERGGRPFESEYPGSPHPYANMTPRFASPQGLAVAEMFKRLIAVQPPGALNTAWTQRQSAFATGHIAMVNEWDVTTPSLADPTQSTVTSDYRVAPFPSNGPLTTQVGGWSMGMSKYGSQQALAWDFIEWFTSAQTAKTFSLAGGFPARSSLLADPALRAKYPWYAVLQHVVPTAFADCRPRISESFDIINTLGTEIGEALAGDISVRDAMLRADQEIGTLLKKDGYRVDALDR